MKIQLLSDVLLHPEKYPLKRAPNPGKKRALNRGQKIFYFCSKCPWKMTIYSAKPAANTNCFESPKKAAYWPNF